MKQIYFDHAATTPLLPEVADLMHDILKNTYGNPSSIHATGRKAKAIIEEARVQIAKLMGCNPSEICYTSGGTESDNIALRKAVACAGVKNIITTPIEHHAVLSTAELLQEESNINLHLLKVDEKGNFSLAEMEKLLQNNKNCLVSIMHANNELGNLSNIDAIGKLCKQYEALFHTDAVQTVGYFNFNLAESNIDFLSASAHKFNGPKGIGFLYIKKGLKITGLITGGGQERSLRAGTENVASIAGMAKALSACYANLPEKSAHIKSIKQHFVKQLQEAIPTVTFNGDVDNSHYTVINVCLPNSEAADLFLFNLDLRGIAASGGSACSSGASQGSHVLTAIKCAEDKTNLRFSFGVFNKIEEVDEVIECLKSMMPESVKC